MGGRPFCLYLFSLCILCTSVVRSAQAHPVPKDNHDRTIVVRLTPRAVEVNYRLDLDEGRAARDVAREELAGISTPEEFHRAFVRWLGPILADNLDARLDGKPLVFDCVKREATDKDGDTPLLHLRCTFAFQAVWEPAPGRAHTLTFREANYHDDDFSILQVSLAVDSGFRLTSVTAPDKALQERPALDRKPGDGERLRKVSATFTLAEGVEKGDNKPAPAPPTGPRAEKAPPANNRPRDLLHLLLDTRRGLAVLLLLAVVLGAAHALTPGHGKTLVAAYLIGERGTVGHAVLLGIVTTITHTAAVLLLAALLPVFFKDTPDAAVQSALGLAGGLLIAGLGLWLLFRRLAGQADHVHLPGHGHHPHHHGHEHDHDQVHLPAGGKVGFWQLVVLGVQGGIVPCWDAIAMLCVAISAQRLWLGLPLLLAFSAGLAGVLILIGIGVVYTRDWAGSRWGDGPRARRIARALPLASAVLITLMGLWLCYDSTHGAPDSAPPRSQKL
jgi:nickel/cobalt exporter